MIEDANIPYAALYKLCYVHFDDSLTRTDNYCVLLSLFFFIVMQHKTVVCPTYVQLINLHVLIVLNLRTF